MRKNNKGFTMIELLAVVTIMGILMVVAVPAVTKYITKGRNQSTETMLKSTYEAAVNYMMENDEIVGSSGLTINVSDLVSKQYLEPLIDPIGNEADCGGTGSIVEVSKDDTTAGGLANYKYKVTLVCPQSGTLIYTFPKDDMLSNMLDGAIKYAKDNNWYEAIANGSIETVSYQTLLSGNYIQEIKNYRGDSCNQPESKVNISYEGNNYKYEVALKCGTKTYNGEYAYK